MGELRGYDEWKSRTPDPHEGEREPGRSTRCAFCGERIRYHDAVVRIDDSELVHEDCR